MKEEPNKPTLRLIRQITADGVLSVEEVWDLGHFLNDSRDARHAWPGTVLWDTLQSIFEDGVVSEEELEALGSIIQDIDTECASVEVGAEESEPAQSISIEPFLLPAVEQDSSLQTEGGHSYEIRWAGPTCSCAEWRKNRGHLAARHPGRLCQHLVTAYKELVSDSNRLVCPVSFAGLIKELADLFRGTEATGDWKLVHVGNTDYLLVTGKDAWSHVHGVSQSGEHERFSYNRENGRWFFGQRPRDAAAILEGIAGLAAG